jgi:hypothetical protein
MPYKTTSVFTEHTNLPNHCEQITRTTIERSDTKEQADVAKLCIMRRILQLLGNTHVRFFDHSSNHGMQTLEQLIQCEINMHNLEGKKYQWTFTCEETAE